MNRSYQIKKTAFALPRRKRRTIIDRDVWLWTPIFRKSEMTGKIVIPCSMDEIVQKLFDPERETQWTLTFGHKEESI